jgi:hypothetical protein
VVGRGCSGHGELVAFSCFGNVGTLPALVASQLDVDDTVLHSPLYVVMLPDHACCGAACSLQGLQQKYNAMADYMNKITYGAVSFKPEVRAIPVQILDGGRCLVPLIAFDASTARTTSDGNTAIAVATACAYPAAHPAAPTSPLACRTTASLAPSRSPAPGAPTLVTHGMGPHAATRHPGAGSKQLTRLPSSSMASTPRLTPTRLS